MIISVDNVIREKENIVNFNNIDNDSNYVIKMMILSMMIKNNNVMILIMILLQRA